MEIVKTTPQDLLDSMWHQGAIYKFKIEGEPYEKQLKVKETIMGCGLMQIWGVSSVKEETLDKYQQVIDLIKEDYKFTGAIIATLGEKYYDKEMLVMKLGFEFLSEYNNYRHARDGSYKQRLYILKL